jgi:hypothetical protein
MRIDDELRTTLHSYAAEVEPGGDLWGAVQKRSHRLAVRRRIRFAAAAMVATVLVVAGPFAWRGLDGTHRPAPRPAASSPAGYRLPSGMLLDPLTDQIPMFPVTATWEPEWAGHGGAMLTPAGMVRHYYKDPARWLSIFPEPSQPAMGDPAKSRRITVQGRPATIWTASRSDEISGTYVVWQHRADLWIRVRSQGPVGEATLLRFAEGVVDRPSPLVSAVRCPYLPSGLGLQFLQGNEMTFGRKGGDPTSPEAKLIIELALPHPRQPDAPTDIPSRAAGSPVTVGGRQGTVFLENDGIGVQIRDERWDGGILWVFVPNWLAMTRQDVIAFAATVQVDPTALR